MIIPTDSEAYGLIRKSYMENCKTIKFLDTEGFEMFLQENNARLIKPDLSRDGIAYACDHLGVIVGKDSIEFIDDKDYTLFVLKWS